MKQCYMVTYGSEVHDDYVFTDYEKARKRLQQLRDEAIEDAKKYGDKTNGHWYGLKVFQLVEEE